MQFQKILSLLYNHVHIPPLIDMLIPCYSMLQRNQVVALLLGHNTQKLDHIRGPQTGYLALVLRETRSKSACEITPMLLLSCDQNTVMPRLCNFDKTFVIW